MQKIVLTGGGSGGHIIPAMALLPTLRQHFDKIYYVGEKQSMEQEIATQNGLDFYSTPAIKYNRGKLIQNLGIPFVLPYAIAKARQLLKKLAPDVVYCKGGYVALPTSLAAISLKIPVVVHESDSTLGLANKIVAKHAKYIISPSKISDKSNYIVLPNPIRVDILHATGDSLKQELSLRPGYKNILILGGSLGAQALNDIVKSNIDMLTDKYNILHITGKGKALAISKPGYYPVEYTDKIGEYYAIADLVISRAGAGVIQELLALGKRAILVPLPSDCSRGDQVANAKTSGYTTINQNALNIDILCDNISSVLASKAPAPKYDSSIPKQIVDIILRAKIQK